MQVAVHVEKKPERHQGSMQRRHKESHSQINTSSLSKSSVSEVRHLELQASKVLSALKFSLLCENLCFRSCSEIRRLCIRKMQYQVPAPVRLQEINEAEVLTS